MTAFRVLRRCPVLYLDTPQESQLHKLNRLWQPGRAWETHRTLTGDNFDTPVVPPEPPRSTSNRRLEVLRGDYGRIL